MNHPQPLPKRETQTADNRAAFPATAAVVDNFRAIFGDGVKLIFAEEGGKTIGKKPARAKHFVTAEQWLQGSKLIKDDLARLAKKAGARRV